VTISVPHAVPCVRRTASAGGLRRRVAFTLLEMLVAVAASLLLLGTVMTLFQMVGSAVGQSRTLATLDREFCAIRTSLLMDLAGATAARDDMGLVVATPLQRGYFSIVEGPNTDIEEYIPATDTWFNRAGEQTGPTASSDDRIVGDTDDMLFFTTTSITATPFTGRYGIDANQNPLLERSSLAEVAYFCRPNPLAADSNPRLYTLYRRQVVVLESVPKEPFKPSNQAPFINWGGWADFLNAFDVSVRREGDPAALAANFLVVNNLDDLARRQNRLGHDWLLNQPADSSVPRPDDGAWPLKTTATQALILTGARESEEQLARNVLAFDVRVLDPLTMIRRTANGAIDLQPGDPGYWTAPVTSERAPRFVDLGYDPNPNNPSASRFSGYGKTDDDHPPGHPLSLVPLSRAGNRTYDTWHHAQKRPPYTQSLPAISITLRLYDRSSRQVRQSTVVHSFEQN
jgi:hypothetical protein